MGGAGVSDQDLIGEVVSATTSLDLKRALRSAVHATGFQYFQLQRFKLRHLTDIPWLELPPALSSAMTKLVPGRADPMALRALDAGQPFWWHDLGNCSDLREPDVPLLQAFEAAGLRFGATLPVHGPGGNCDVLHVWCESPPPAKSAVARLMLLAAVAHVCCLRLHQLDSFSFGAASEATLSARELEVLRWCKDGKSYSEIGTIMGISSKTVEFHIANVMRKLGVNQKITAIIAAIRQGLISI